MRLLDSGIASTPEALAEVLGPMMASAVWDQHLTGNFIDVRDGGRTRLVWNGYGEALIIKARPPSPAAGSGPKLALIGCSAAKLSRPAPVRHLYQGQLFKLAVRWCEAVGLPWAILSAKHGLVRPDTVLEPYDERLPTNDKDRKHWIWSVNWRTWERAPYGRLWLLCGREYTQAFQGHLHDRCLPNGGRPFELVQPFASLGIGEQRAWLSRELVAATQLELRL